MSCNAVFQSLHHLWSGKKSNMPIDVSYATLYAGYGSNLWLHQMEQRCPTSKYLGIARLNNYRWIINERGYANVVEISGEDTLADKKSYANEVWSMVYSLEKKDEKKLDRNEGVPFAYTKETMAVDFWPASENNAPNIKDEPKKVDVLVYINREMVSSDKPKTEYIYRMNMGIRDALQEGIPEGYVEEVMREFIPEEDKAWEKVANEQATHFEDGR